MKNWDSNTIRAKGKEIQGGGIAGLYLFPWLSLGEGRWIHGYYTGEQIVVKTKDSIEKGYDPLPTPIFLKQGFEVEGGWEKIFNNVQEYHSKNPKTTSGQQTQKLL